MTLSDSEPKFQGHSLVQRRISRTRCIRSNLCLVLGKGFRVGGSNGAISGSIISKMAADGHLEMTALSLVIICVMGFLVSISYQCSRLMSNRVDLELLCSRLYRCNLCNTMSVILYEIDQIGSGLVQEWRVCRVGSRKIDTRTIIIPTNYSFSSRSFTTGSVTCHVKCYYV